MKDVDRNFVHYLKQSNFFTGMGGAILLLLLLVSLVNTPAVASSITATNWYVAPDGNDSQDCLSTSTACATINEILTNHLVAGDTIIVASGVYTENLTITTTVTIQGESPLNTIINGNGNRVIMIDPTSVVTLNNLTITGGRTSNGPAGGDAQPGAGIYNLGTLALNNSVVTNNNTGNGGVSSFLLNGGTGGNGAGIYNGGSLTLNQTTISFNTTGDGGAALAINAAGGGGGDGAGIYNAGILMAHNSTISNNRNGDGGDALALNTINGDGGSGAGIYNTNSIDIINSTIASNRTGGIGSGILTFGVAGSGGGIRNETGTVNFNNTILADNTIGSGGGGTGPNCSGSLNSQGYNLVESTAGCTLTGMIATNITGVDPQLRSLAIYNGETPIHVFEPTSPVIDAGNPATPGSGANTCLPTDQEGNARPQQNACDIGAFEASAELILSKEVTPAIAVRDQPVTYTISFSNTGILTATGVVITDIIPSQLTNLSYIHSGVALTQTNTGILTYTWEVANIGENQMGIIIITAELADLPPQDVFTNTATISTDIFGEWAGNNTDSAVLIPDADGDGLPDSIESGTQDGDMDGLPDYLDTDSDGDGLTDAYEGTGDVDGDGIPDYLDVDSDGDGIMDVAETGNGALDADGDGVIDDQTDTDGDGLADLVDTDNGGTTPTPSDSDGDGIPDQLEPNNQDTDGNGTPNHMDSDDDGDGIDTSVECPAGLPGSCPDSDLDGIPDYLESNTNDADADGIPDYLDTDSDGDGLTDAYEGTGDVDGDGLADYLDVDSDGDGIMDVAETGNGALDADGDGVIDDQTDTDGDGLADLVDTDNGGTTPTPSDSDGDGIPDQLEPNNQDTDGNGTPNHMDSDDDGDGIDTSVECPAGLPGSCPDSDLDGIPDYLDGNCTTGIASSPNVSIMYSGNDVTLTWLHNILNLGGYEVYYATVPYFDPSTDGTLLTNTPTISGMDRSAAHLMATGNSSNNYFYIVRGLNCDASDIANSNNVAEFDFDIVPGS